MSHNYGYNFVTRSVLDVGVLNQTRAGRELVVADFTTLLGLSTPVGLWDAGSLTNLGSGGNLVNKGTVLLTAKGISGTANHAAQFTGNTGQVLYIADTGSSDPFRIKTGSWGCWFRTAKLGAFYQTFFAKSNAAQTDLSYSLIITTGTNVLRMSLAGSAAGAWDIDAMGTTMVCDDRWHHLVTTFDGVLMRCWLDGVLEMEASSSAAVPLRGSAGPFNIGGLGGDGSNPSSSPFWGRIAAPFVTADVLNEDQVRLLYATKLSHGLTSVPTEVKFSVRRYRKGGPFVTGDFTASPRRLYNFTAAALTDAGLDNQTLSLAQGTLTAVAGADGTASSAAMLSGSAYLGGAITGLPTGTSPRAIGTWVKVGVGAAQGTILDYGLNATGAGEFWTYIDGASGQFSHHDGSTNVAGGADLRDGQWHFVVIVIDTTAVDGVIRRLYVDGKLVAGSTSLVGTGTTAGSLVVGTRTGGSSYLTGSLDGLFFTDYGMAEDEVLKLYAKGSLGLGISPKNPGDHIEQVDSTSIYVIGDTLDSQHQIDIGVVS